MKPLKLIWTEAALADLRDISEYIASRNVRAARKLEDAILACADRLTQHPLMYKDRTGEWNAGSHCPP
ncbi:type II toxin-antitoxin system RelE/ParE family toxin [Blastomonas natatoria]|uniref:type II toxin-antitoxin system RelE/ParE family toxin n=1 Tax=Blastomonas natatoria TaxID=34015 RepID=UPI002448440E|nr:type II toxin-antitoxin system RelE/ParE family toxin [Blastomonas natatoria]